MGKKICLVGRSNWETFAWLLISRIHRNDCFSRSDLMKDENLLWADSMLQRLGHKERQKATIHSMQSSLNKLTNNGFLCRVARGDYRLTDNGLKTMAANMHAVDKIVETLRGLQSNGI